MWETEFVANGVARIGGSLASSQTMLVKNHMPYSFQETGEGASKFRKKRWERAFTLFSSKILNRRLSLQQKAGLI